MKMSIVLGVIHMSFAICLQVPNHLHFHNKRFIIAEWLPQILFMESLFGPFYVPGEGGQLTVLQAISSS
jgi:V-type H+-transporting ATPase subunit a